MTPAAHRHACEVEHQERAAILEHDGGLTREDSDLRASDLTGICYACGTGKHGRCAGVLACRCCGELSAKKA